MSPSTLENGKYCYIILFDQRDENGFIPSIIQEGILGHRPMTGQGDYSVPWYWGKTFGEAQKVCEEKNQRLGISPQRAIEIYNSTQSEVHRNRAKEKTCMGFYNLGN